MKSIKLALFTPNLPFPAKMIQAQRRSWDINVLIVILPTFAKASGRHVMVSLLGFVTAIVSHHRSVMNAQNTFTRINPKRNDTHIGAFRMKHGDVSLKLSRKRQKQVMPKCADVQLTMEMHRMLRTFPLCSSKQQGDTASILS